MAFIIDRYCKYDMWDRAHSVYKFEINGNWYAIKEIEMRWGVPYLPTRIEDSTDTKQYQVYESLEEAMTFVHQIKKLN